MLFCAEPINSLFFVENRHTARFLLIWLSLLPFGLWSTIGWAMVPTNVLIAALLLGIEEIGVQIEEPFGYA